MGTQWEFFTLGQPRLQWAKAQNGSIKGSSVSLTRGIVKNQRTRELISVQKTSHKHNHKDLCQLWYLSPGMRGCTCGGVYVPCTYQRMYLWWSLCTLYISEDVPVVEFMSLVCIRGCTSGGVYVPCIYSHARWELPQATQVFVVVCLTSSLCSLTPLCVDSARALWAGPVLFPKGAWWFVTPVHVWWLIFPCDFRFRPAMNWIS